MEMVWQRKMPIITLLLVLLISISSSPLSLAEEHRKPEQAVVVQVGGGEEANNTTSQPSVSQDQNTSRTRNVSVQTGKGQDRNPLSDILAGIAEIAEEGVSGTTALLLILGGLLILLVIVPISMINSMFWRRNHMTHEDKRSSNMYSMGLHAGRSIDSNHVDDIIEALKDMENVSVRVVNSTAHYKILRVTGCNSCRNRKAKRAICYFEQGFLEGAFGRLQKGVKVTETVCRARDGKGYCEFEIRHRR